MKFKIKDLREDWLRVKNVHVNSKGYVIDEKLALSMIDSVTCRSKKLIKCKSLDQAMMIAHVYENWDK